MYKVAILGCENSHANQFLKAVINENLVPDIEFVGVYSHEPEASAKLNEMFGVPVAESYDEFVGKVDGIIITARHGDNHYKYAKPYLDCGIPIFIDKPITCTEEDAKAFMQDLKARNIPVSGGSVCVYNEFVQELKAVVADKTYGEVNGGFLRCPINMDNPHGGFFFYTQHLAQVMMEIFGNYPETVRAWQQGETVHVDVHYADYDVDLSYVPGSVYYASVSAKTNVVGNTYTVSGYFPNEFMDFYRLLKGEPQKQSYEDFFAPVFVLNAINRSLLSGEVERVKRVEEI